MDGPLVSTPLHTPRVFAVRERAVALVAFGAVMLQAAAAVAFASVYGFDVGHGRVTEVAALIERGPGVATAFRWALLLDMLGYLAFAPVVVYLYGRLDTVAETRSRRTWLVRVATLGGLAFSLVGALGATLLAAAGPPLIEAAASADQAAVSAAQVGFAAISSAVNFGFFGPLEWLALGVWAGVLGWFVRREGRAFGWVAVLAGVGAVAYAARVGTTGMNPLDNGEPIDFVVLPAVGLFLLLELWLAARLWSGR